MAGERKVLLKNLKFYPQHHRQYTLLRCHNYDIISLVLAFENLKDPQTNFGPKLAMPLGVSAGVVVAVRGRNMPEP